MRSRRIVAFVLLSIAIASPLRAESVGWIAAHDRNAVLELENSETRGCPTPVGAADPDKTCPLRTQMGALSIGDKVQTSDDGRAIVYLSDKRYPDDQQQFEMLHSTRVKIRESGVRLLRGDIHWLGPGTADTPDGQSVTARNSEFILRRHEDGTTEVIALSDDIEVRDAKQSKSEMLSSGDQLRIKPGEWLHLEALDPAALARERAPFLFIGGGRAQSQTIRNALLDGDDVPNPDRAPLPPPRWKEDDRLWPEQPVIFDLLVNF